MRRPTGLLLGTAVLAGIFLSVLLREDATLRNSLVDLGILPTIRRDTVQYASPTPLQGDLSTRTLTPAESPYLLIGRVRIPPESDVRIAAGTIIVAAEGAHLVVEGTLGGAGASFTSNQRHPRRQFWHGITVRDGGAARLARVLVTHATAALTCAAGGRLELTDSALVGNVAAVVTLPRNSHCAIRGTTIADGRAGLFLVGGNPILERLTLDRTAVGLRIFHRARPRITGLDVRHPLQSALIYTATPPLRISRLTLPQGADPGTLIVDGADAPTHRFQGDTHPTGEVLLQ